MVPLPSNTTVVCNETSGAWVRKLGGGGAVNANSTGEEPEDLGRVPYTAGMKVPWLESSDGG